MTRWIQFTSDYFCILSFNTVKVWESGRMRNYLGERFPNWWVITLRGREWGKESDTILRIALQLWQKGKFFTYCDLEVMVASRGRGARNSDELSAGLPLLQFTKNSTQKQLPGLQQKTVSGFWLLFLVNWRLEEPWGGFCKTPCTPNPGRRFIPAVLWSWGLCYCYSPSPTKTQLVPSFYRGF